MGQGHLYLIDLTLYYDHSGKLHEITAEYESVAATIEKILNLDKADSFILMVTNTTGNDRNARMPEYEFVLEDLLHSLRDKDSFLYRDVFLKLAEEDHFSESQLPVYLSHALLSVLADAFSGRFHFASGEEEIGHYTASLKADMLPDAFTEAEEYRFEFFAPQKDVPKEIERISQLDPYTIVKYILPIFYRGLKYDAATGVCINPNGDSVRNIGDYSIEKD